MQLHPHFLFNTLNTISALVGSRPEEARDPVFIAQLAALLRDSIEGTDRGDLSAAARGGAANRYLRIVCARFGARLKPRLDVLPGLEHCPVPHGLLLTLLENAVTHGVSMVTGESELSLRCALEHELLVVEVRNRYDPDATPLPAHRGGLCGADYAAQRPVRRCLRAGIRRQWRRTLVHARHVARRLRTREARGRGRRGARACAAGAHLIRALIVDDEPPARGQVREFLAAEPDVLVVGEGADGEDAVRQIVALQPDLLFMDIRMPRMSASRCDSKAQARLPYTIFTTAYAHYAVEAFAVEALDYLMKPLERSRFHEAVGRARRYLARDASLVRRIEPETVRAFLANLEAAGGSARGERLAIKTGRRVRFLDLPLIEYVSADGDYVAVHLRGDRCSGHVRASPSCRRGCRTRAIPAHSPLADRQPAVHQRAAFQQARRLYARHGERSSSCGQCHLCSRRGGSPRLKGARAQSAHGR